MQLGLVADPVIEAIARLEFENVEAAGTLVAAAPNPGSILHQTGGAGWSWGQCGCQKSPVRPNSNSAEFREWVVLNNSSYVVLG